MMVNIIECIHTESVLKADELVTELGVIILDSTTDKKIIFNHH